MFSNIGMLHYRFYKLWPLILIGLGAYRLWQMYSATGDMESVMRHPALMGPAMLLTVGIIFLVVMFAHVGFWTIAPLILLVIGVVKLLQSTAPDAPPAPPAPISESTPSGSTPEEREVHNG